MSVSGRIVVKWILKKQRCDPVEWIQLTQDRDQWHTFLNTVPNFQISEKPQNILNN